jgi:hypothetical protein
MYYKIDHKMEYIQIHKIKFRYLYLAYYIILYTK